MTMVSARFIRSNLQANKIGGWLEKACYSLLIKKTQKQTKMKPKKPNSYISSSHLPYFSITAFPSREANGFSN